MAGEVKGEHVESAIAQALAGQEAEQVEVQETVGQGEATPEQQEEAQVTEPTAEQVAEQELREKQSKVDKLRAAIAKKDKDLEMLQARFGNDPALPTEETTATPASPPAQSSKPANSEEDLSEYLTKADLKADLASFQQSLRNEMQQFVGQVKNLDQERAASQYLSEYLDVVGDYLSEGDFQAAIAQTKYLNPATPALERARVAKNILKGMLADKLQENSQRKAETKVMEREQAMKAVAQPDGSASAPQPAETESDKFVKSLRDAGTPEFHRNIFGAAKS